MQQPSWPYVRFLALLFFLAAMGVLAIAFWMLGLWFSLNWGTFLPGYPAWYEVETFLFYIVMTPWLFRFFFLRGSR